MVLIPIAFGALLAASQGEVKLPLPDYLALVERAEEVERETALRAQSAEPVVAELTSQRTSIVWEDESASITTTYEVQLRGGSPPGVALPVTGLVASAEIRPQGNASLQAMDSGLVFLSPDPGRYEIEVRSRAPIAQAGGFGRLALAPFLSPAGEFELTMAEDLFFRCPPAIVAGETIENGQRNVRFALPRGEGVVVEARRDLMGAEASELLASAVVVTLLDLRVDGPLRHDVVLYEVSRGQLEVHELTLPEGLEVERLVTDEGEAPALVLDRALRIDRTAKLEGTGYVVVTSRPEDAEPIPLLPIVPRTKVRARYLGSASSIAATVVPIPEKAWLRADLGDLPGPLGNAVSLDLVSAWRLADAEAAVSARVSARPAAPIRETVVTERDSLTLLTAEGTLVFRDRLTVSSRASAIGVRLPPGAVLWSLRANDTLVRPVERGGELLVPLGFGKSDGGIVEIVAVQERAVPAERTRLELSLAEIDVPVLTHRWQMMLPEGNRYRYLSGDLLPPSPVEISVRRKGGRLSLDAAPRAMGMGGSASIRGRVVDRDNLALPGATVILVNENTGWSATIAADGGGNFSFAALPSGSYTLTADLVGFNSARYEGIRIASGQSEAYAIPLQLGGVSESVTVTGEAPRALSDMEPSEREAPEGQTSPEFREEAARLRQGLVGGVKPIPIVIPQTGKLLVLTGALPPRRVSAAIEMKPK